MAISRCQNCGRPTSGVKQEYVASVYPIGYPDTAVICGAGKGCHYPGLVWLTTREYSQYQQGVRIFELPTNAIRVRVV